MVEQEAFNFETEVRFLPGGHECVQAAVYRVAKTRLHVTRNCSNYGKTKNVSPLPHTKHALESGETPPDQRIERIACP